MAKRKKINLKELLRAADELLIPRAVLVKQYGLKNKASLRSMLSVARKKFGQKSPMHLRGQTPKVEGKAEDWVLQPANEVRTMTTSTRPINDPNYEIPATAIGLRVEYPHLSEESAKMREGYLEKEEKAGVWNDAWGCFISKELDDKNPK